MIDMNKRHGQTARVIQNRILAVLQRGGDIDPTMFAQWERAVAIEKGSVSASELDEMLGGEGFSPGDMDLTELEDEDLTALSNRIKGEKMRRGRAAKAKTKSA